MSRHSLAADAFQLSDTRATRSLLARLVKASSATVLRHRLRELTVRVQEELALASALANAISKPIEDDVLSDVCLSRARQVSLEGGVEARATPTRVERLEEEPIQQQQHSRGGNLGHCGRWWRQ